MNKIRSAFVLLLLLPYFSACVPSNPLSNEDMILKAMGEGLLGPAIKQLPTKDRKLALESEYTALENTLVGKSVNWRTATGEASGTVTAGQPYKVGSQDCRQYSHAFTINGVPQSIHGSACRNEDGTWSPLT